MAGLRQKELITDEISLQLLSDLRKAAHKQSRAHEISWSRHWLEIVEKFQGFYSELLHKLQKISDRREKYVLLEESLQQLEQFINQINIEPAELEIEATLERLQAIFARRLSRENSEPWVVLEPKECSAVSGDKICERFHRLCWRFRLHLNNGRIKLFNLWRILLHRTPLPPEPLFQRISLPDRVDHLVYFPFAQKLTCDWCVQLQTGDEVLENLHRICENVKRSWLQLVQEDEDDPFAGDYSSYMDSLQKMRSPLLKRTTSGRTARDESFAAQWQEIETNWKERWKIPVQPNCRLSEIIRPSADRLKLRLKRCRQRWLPRMNGEISDWQKDIELALFQTRLIQAALLAGSTMGSYWRDEVLPAFRNAEAILAESTHRLEKVGEKNADLKESIARENRILLNKLRKETLPVLESVLRQAEFTDIDERIRETVRELLYRLPEEQTVVRKRPRQSFLPGVKIDRAPLRSLIDSVYIRQFNEQVMVHQNELENRSAQLLQELSELDQIVEFNLETGLSILEKGRRREHIEQAQESVLDGMQRSARVLKNLQKKSDSLFRKAISGLHAEIGSLIQLVHGLSDNDQLIDLKVRLAHARTRKSVLVVWKRALEILRMGALYCWRALKRAFSSLMSWRQNIRKMTGLAPAPIQISKDVSHYLIDAEHAIDKLPIIYQRLFFSDALQDMRFFVGHTSIIDSLRQQLELWKNNEFSATVLIGDVGSGVTSILNIARQQLYTDRTVRSCTIQNILTTEDELTNFFQQALDRPGATLAEMADELNTGDSQIIILEKLHRLFLRTVDGFSALERFLLFLTQTSKNVHWVVTCNTISWLYLDRIFSISRYYNLIVELKGLDATNLQNFVLKRHRMSGFALDFLPSELLRRNRSYRRLRKRSDRQQFLRTRYFSQLEEQSGGNLSIALLYWLSSIERVSDEKFSIAPLNLLDHSFLYQFPLEELMTLAAVLLSDSLTAAQHALIFRQSQRLSELILHRLCNSGILLCNEGAYRVHPFLYRPVVRALMNKNILQM